MMAKRTTTTTDDTPQEPAPADDGTAVTSPVEETPVERAVRLGQGDEINPLIPTGQTPEQTAAAMPGPASNEELHKGGIKHAQALGDQLDPDHNA